jgi:hypothetical protein
VIEVKMEREVLDTGIPMMHRDLGSRVRIAYDPSQTSEGAAVACLCLRIPRLAHNMNLHRLYP